MCIGFIWSKNVNKDRIVVFKGLPDKTISVKCRIIEIKTEKSMVNGKNGLYPPRENGHIRSLFYGLAMKIQI